MRAQTTLSAVLLTEMHVKSTFGALRRLYVSSAWTVVPRRTWNPSVHFVGTEVSGWAIADSTRQDRSLMTDHPWAALSDTGPKVDGFSNVVIFLAASTVDSYVTVIRQIVVKTIFVRQVAHDGNRTVVSRSAFLTW